VLSTPDVTAAGGLAALKLLGSPAEILRATKDRLFRGMRMSGSATSRASKTAWRSKPSDWTQAGLPIIRIENLNSPNALFNRTSGAVRSRNRVESGDLLVSWSASLDAYIWDRGPAVLNQHIFRVVEDQSVIDRLYLYLGRQERHVEDPLAGSWRDDATHHQAQFEAVKIPLPPILAQRELAVSLSKDLASCEQMKSESKPRPRRQIPPALARLMPLSRKSRHWPMGVPMTSRRQAGDGRDSRTSPASRADTLPAVDVQTGGVETFRGSSSPISGPVDGQVHPLDPRDHER